MKIKSKKYGVIIKVNLLKKKKLKLLKYSLINIFQKQNINKIFFHILIIFRISYYYIYKSSILYILIYL